MDHSSDSALLIQICNLYSAAHRLNGTTLLRGLIQANNTNSVLRKWAVKLSKLLSIDGNSQLHNQWHFSWQKSTLNLENRNKWKLGTSKTDMNDYTQCRIHWIIKNVMNASIQVIGNWGMQCDLCFSIISGHLKM